MKSLRGIAFLVLVILTACTTISNSTPTPTIVPLHRTPMPPSEPQFDDRPATATAIPFPSPTPTLTPLVVVQSQVIATATAVPTPAPQAEVIVASLNIRQGPGMGYPVMGVARAGDLFDVVGVNNSGNWLQVVVGDDEVGWISGQTPYTRLLSSRLDDVPVVQAAVLVPATITANAGGGQLIFMTGSGGNLYAVRIDGSNLRRLTGGVIDPVVSPDGRQVAFTRWDGAEFGSLHIINVDSTGERVVKNDIRQPKSPTWSPDGQQLVISYQHGGLRDPENVCKYYSPGNFPRLSSRVTISSFRVSGDGSINVCFTPFEDLHWKLAQIDVATGAFEDLPSDEYSYNPAWDPQNPWRVLYDGNHGLVQLDVTNGNRWPITEDLRDTGPVFSPDGRKLALTYKQHDHWEVYTLDLETGERWRLTKPPILADPQYNSAAPAWSPDGTYLAFLTDRIGRWEIWVMAADGSDQRPLLPPEIQTRLNLEYHGVNERMLNWTE